MPIGVICNVLALVLGGIAGAKFGHRLTQEFREKLNLVFSVCAMGLGIQSVIQVKNMPAVILAMLLGSALGIVMHLGRRIEGAGIRMAALFPQKDGTAESDRSLMVTAIVLFCASGTGIYGSIVSGINGDHTILIAKSILDFFTAAIFACSLGMAVSAIAVPQLVLFLALFLGARLIYPLTTPSMIDDFKACGGLILLATGLRIARIRDYPVADMIPAMILVWPISYVWSAWIVPLL